MLLKAIADHLQWFIPLVIAFTSFIVGWLVVLSKWYSSLSNDCIRRDEFTRLVEKIEVSMREHDKKFEHIFERFEDKIDHINDRITDIMVDGKRDTQKR